MSNLGNFSPFKRSYQFIHMQNSAYHHRNKQQVKPQVKTNVKPANKSQSMYQRSRNRSRSEAKLSDRYSQANSQIIASVVDQSFTFKEPHRVIHRNEGFERIKSARIDN